MLTPYDWQEAIGHRAQFVESRIAGGVPVLAVGCEEGIVAATYRRQARKLYEVYDRLMYAAIGQQSDIESLRVAAVEFAHREGYQRSEQDVTIQRVVTALSQPIKDAFANFSSAPWVARAVFMEVGEVPEDDRFYVLDYDGDYTVDHQRVCLAGSPELEAKLEETLKPAGKTASPRAVAQRLKKALDKVFAAEGLPDASADGMSFEAALLARHKTGDRRFWLITPEEE